MGLEDADEWEMTLEDAFNAFKSQAVGIDRDRALLETKVLKDLLKQANVSIAVISPGVIQYTIPPDERRYCTATWRSVAFTLQAASQKFPRNMELTAAYELIAAFFDRVANCDAICIARGIREI